MTQSSLEHVEPGIGLQAARAIAADLFQEAGWKNRRRQMFRLDICPVERLLPFVPSGSNVLDIGCGAGLLLGLLARERELSRGVGFDAAPASIQIAKKMAARLEQENNPAKLEFIHVPVQGEWPSGQFDVVTIVDVMHHVPIKDQQGVIETAATKVKPGGLLLYKDMVRRPFWRAWANRLHDLVFACDWIHYCPIENIQAWSRQAGLEQLHFERIDRLWYGHELCLFRLPDSPQR